MVWLFNTLPIDKYIKSSYNTHFCLKIFEYALAKLNVLQK